MIRKYFFLVLALVSAVNLSAQQSFDASFPFETDPNKKFSLYLPSAYSPGTPNKLMLAFHPLGTSALVWRNELRDFAEDNDLILVCPDGGTDGRVDDPLDYRFTTALLDSVEKWYNIDEAERFAMGFSVGGKATYEYGLENASYFAGFIPVGAAINGTTGLESHLTNALCKPFYLVHGENDAPGTRYTPIKNALIANKAEVDFILMAGVGHTFSFPNRNSILNTAFRWVDTVQCTTSTGIDQLKKYPAFRLYPTVVSANDLLNLEVNLSRPEVITIEIYSMDGKMIYRGSNSYSNGVHPLSVRVLKPGAYLLRISASQSIFSQQFMVK